MSEYENLEEEVIKKPQHEQELTEEQANEWIKCANDKYYWMEKYVMVTSPNGLVNFKARPYQERIIKLSEENRFTIVMSGRQTGKTATLAVDCMHDLIFKDNYRIGVTSYTDDNTQDLRERFGEIYENLPFWMKPVVRIYNTKVIKFKHGSSVQFKVTSVKTFRGKSLHRIVVDEFAHVEPKIAEDFMTALLPSITGGGTEANTKLNIISTPNGTSGMFASLWFNSRSGKNDFANTKVEYEEIPNRGEEFERDMLKKMSKNKFDQEYRCQMISDKGTLVNSRVIEAIKSIEPKSQMGDLSIFVDDLSGRKLAMACDVGEGVGADYHAIQIFDINSLEQVAEYENNFLSQTKYAKQIIRIITYLYKSGIDDLYFTIENNGISQGVIRLLENSEDEYLQKATVISDLDGKRYGLNTNKKTRDNGCMGLKDMIEMDKLDIHSEALKVQLQFFVKKGAKYEAESGMHDDLVMACVIMVNMLEILANYEDGIYDVINELDTDGDSDECFDIFF